jgi:ribonuclease-3
MAALTRELEAFCQRLGHDFSDAELLRHALTHSSFSSVSRPDNQRLEFLGDRVLGLVMAQAVLEHDPDAREGLLAPRFNTLVRKETCADVAREIDLGAVLRLGKSEMATGGRRKMALLGDAMEAVIAAIYLDGGFEVAQAVVMRLWGARLDNVAEDARDPKTALQEWAQARGQTPPRYHEVARSGPDHAPIFTIEATMSDGASARAQARVKRQAEQEAARLLLHKLSG